jgi:hypothetical protein
MIAGPGMGQAQKCGRVKPVVFFDYAYYVYIIFTYIISN